MDLTHASFFSGVGGLDLGLTRAGWDTVSLSEIAEYQSAVLAERWPGIPNLGDITRLADTGLPIATAAATLWSGGFPCQDLSVAGKRRGFDGERSVLAFTFLDLVERYRPAALLLENVPGLLSSSGGRDFGRLLGEVVELGYGWAYRILDAQHFGVPQRRRRVYIICLDTRRGLDARGAAAVLAVGAGCERHHPKGRKARTLAARVAQAGSDDPSPSLSLTGSMHKRHDEDTDTVVVGTPPDASGVRAADGLAGRLDDSGPMATLNSGGNSGGFRTEPGEHLIVSGDSLRGREGGSVPEPFGDVVPTLRGADGGSTQPFVLASEHGSGDALVPVGLDSHRYRCCGNGVVTNVAEWIGGRLAQLMRAV